ncbi:MAG: bifunctional prephenate dehydrogenase/3-phosphoshikimate 1-carboxyvinyltransferase, partial [Candidatus Omnitrophica bacterium]|nr:bifunctional prephenate dehydrogenase/3-phosphoshikimate 1-carboxyvinyltransferase [Candidatus Omnitrophota bacterium]
DFSSAAFFLVAAACIPGSRLTLNQVGINPTRIALLRVLQQMGARVEWTVERDSWEPSGTMTVEARPLTGVTLQSTDAPSLIDELPVLLVAAACAQGTTRLSGMGELRVKETDRIRSMVNGLRQLGVRMDLPAPDVVEIHGGHLTGGVVESAGDHRTAMSLAIAGVANSRGVTRLRGAECVAKSFPEFFDQLRSLAGSSTVKTVDKTGSLC